MMKYYKKFLICASIILLLSESSLASDVKIDHESLLRGVTLIADAQTRLDNAKRLIDEGKYKDAGKSVVTAFTKHGKVRSIFSEAYSTSKQSEYLIRFYFSVACYLAHHRDPIDLHYKILDDVVSDSSHDPWIAQLRCISTLLSGFHKARTYSVGYEVQRHTTKSEAEKRIQAWTADPTNATHLREAIEELRPFITDLAPASARTDGRELVGYYLKLLNTTDVSSLNKFTAIVPCGGSGDPADICRRIDAHARYYMALIFDTLSLIDEHNLTDISNIIDMLSPFENKGSGYGSLVDANRLSNILDMVADLKTKIELLSKTKDSDKSKEVTPPSQPAPPPPPKKPAKPTPPPPPKRPKPTSLHQSSTSTDTVESEKSDDSRPMPLGASERKKTELSKKKSPTVNFDDIRKELQTSENITIERLNEIRSYADIPEDIYKLASAKRRMLILEKKYGREELESTPLLSKRSSSSSKERASSRVSGAVPPPPPPPPPLPPEVIATLSSADSSSDRPEPLRSSTRGSSKRVSTRSSRASTASSKLPNIEAPVVIPESLSLPENIVSSIRKAEDLAKKANSLKEIRELQEIEENLIRYMWIDFGKKNQVEQEQLVAFRDTIYEKIQYLMRKNSTFALRNALKHARAVIMKDPFASEELIEKSLEMAYTLDPDYIWNLRSYEILEIDEDAITEATEEQREEAVDYVINKIDELEKKSSSEREALKASEASRRSSVFSQNSWNSTLPTLDASLTATKHSSSSSSKRTPPPLPKSKPPKPATTSEVVSQSTPPPLPSTPPPSKSKKWATSLPSDTEEVQSKSSSSGKSKRSSTSSSRASSSSKSSTPETIPAAPKLLSSPSKKSTKSSSASGSAVASSSLTPHPPAPKGLLDGIKSGFKLRKVPEEEKTDTSAPMPSKEEMEKVEKRLKQSDDSDKKGQAALMNGLNKRLAAIRKATGGSNDSDAETSDSSDSDD